MSTSDFWTLTCADPLLTGQLQYITEVASRRTADEPDATEDATEDICDVRNGILLHKGLHPLQSLGELVFLRVSRIRCQGRKKYPD